MNTNRDHATIDDVIDTLEKEHPVMIHRAIRVQVRYLLTIVPEVNFEPLAEGLIRQLLSDIEDIKEFRKEEGEF